MIGDMPLEENLEDRMPLTLKEWVRERFTNCMRLASYSDPPKRIGWLEDAECFRQILEILER